MSESPPAVEAGSHDAFMSYAREDRWAAERLRSALSSQGKTVWIDVEDIVGGAEWRARIERGIEACKAFVFILSPDSLRSEHCGQELESASRLNKLIIPVYLRDVDHQRLPASLAEREWVFLRHDDPFDRGVDKLVEALETDIEWRDRHTKLAGRAREWLDSNRDRSALLRGSELHAAEHWLGHQRDHRQRATTEQTEYIVESRRTASARQRLVLAVVGAGLLIAVGLAIFAFVQREEARRQERVAVQQKKTAESRALAARAQVEAPEDPSLAAVLSLEAYRISPTQEAHRTVLGTLNDLRHPSIVLDGHASEALSAAFSPDGRTLATSSFDGTLVLWDTVRHERLGRAYRTTIAEGLRPEYRSINQVAFSPDGRTLALACGDARVRLLDVATRRPKGAALEGHTDWVESVAFSPDGKTLASVGWDGTMRLWDAATGRPRGRAIRASAKALDAVVFSPDGRLLATASNDGTVRLWDVATRRAAALYRANTQAVRSLAFSPDGRLLVAGGGDRTVRLWDVRRSRQLGAPLRGYRGSVWGLSFSPDGRTLASAGDSRVLLWDVARRRMLDPPLTGHDRRVTSVAFSPDGRTLASTSDDSTARLWDVARHRPLSTPLRGHTDKVEGVSFSPDGRTLASFAWDNTVRLWDARDGRPLGGALEGHGLWVNDVAFTPDGKHLASASADGTVRFWDTVRRRAGDVLVRSEDALTSVAISPNGRLLAVGDSFGKLRFWDLARRRPLGPPVERHTYVSGLAFSPDGRKLASAGYEGGVQLWDVTRRRPLGSALIRGPDAIEDVAFSPDGKVIASAGSDTTIVLWDAERRRTLGSPLRGHTGRATDVAFAPDGRTLASASYDQTVRLWDVARRTPLGAPLANHHHRVTGVAFSPDGRTLASASTDKTVRLWDAVLWSRSYGAIQRAVCSRIRRNLTRSQWRAFVPGEDYHASCP